MEVLEVHRLTDGDCMAVDGYKDDIGGDEARRERVGNSGIYKLGVSAAREVRRVEREVCGGGDGYRVSLGGRRGLAGGVGKRKEHRVAGAGKTVGAGGSDRDRLIRRLAVGPPHWGRCWKGAGGARTRRNGSRRFPGRK